MVEGDAEAVARTLGVPTAVHERFGTFTVAGVDVAAARRESYPEPGALPEVELGATVAEDLGRRDFTVNALAVRVHDGAGRRGRAQSRTSRRVGCASCTTRSFVDDPTRVLRMARYIAPAGLRGGAAHRARSRTVCSGRRAAARVGAELARSRGWVSRPVRGASSTRGRARRSTPAFRADPTSSRRSGHPRRRAAGARRARRVPARRAARRGVAGRARVPGGRAAGGVGGSCARDVAARLQAARTPSEVAEVALAAARRGARGRRRARRRGAGAAAGARSGARCSRRSRAHDLLEAGLHGPGRRRGLRAAPGQRRSTAEAGSRGATQGGTGGSAGLSAASRRRSTARGSCSGSRVTDVRARPDAFGPARRGNQVHGTTVLRDASGEADGFVSTQPGVGRPGAHGGLPADRARRPRRRGDAARRLARPGRRDRGRRRPGARRGTARGARAVRARAAATRSARRSTRTSRPTTRAAGTTSRSTSSPPASCARRASTRSTTPACARSATSASSPTVARGSRRPPGKRRVAGLTVDAGARPRARSPPPASGRAATRPGVELLAAVKYLEACRARRARGGRHRLVGREPRPGAGGEGAELARVPLALHRPAAEPQGQADPPVRAADPLRGV